MNSTAMPTPPDKAPPDLDTVLRRMVAAREVALAEAIATRDARIDDLIAQIMARDEALDARDQTISARDAALAAHRASLAASARQIEALTTETRALKAGIARLHVKEATLDRLALSLEWPDGPRAIRTMLPAARLLRRLLGR